VVTDDKKEIDRLSEERDNLLTINKGHKDLNGELQTKLSKKEQEVVALYENVKLKDKTISRLKDRIQEIIKQLVLLCKS
jgi:predicted nuclease with TOPRIM domain